MKTKRTYRVWEEKKESKAKRALIPSIIATALISGILFLTFYGQERINNPAAGLSDDEVVKLFFQSANDLNPDIMDQLITDNFKGKHIDDTVVKESLQLFRPMSNAEEYYKNKEEFDRINRMVFGHRDLVLKREGAGSFIASYEKWESTPENTTGKGDERLKLKRETLFITEKIILKMERGLWKIDEIKTISRKSIGSH